MTGSAYLAAEGFEADLAEDLRRGGARIATWHGRLAISPDAPVPAPWALETWTDPREIPVPSVKAGADALRAIQRNWAHYPLLHHRRSALLAERLPPVKARPLTFPEPAPTGHLGAWTLLAPDRMLASPTKTSPFINGEIRFTEDREGPPSRAYLKLWEALTRIGRHPGPGETCLDLGASPGGWTWVLARLGAGGGGGQGAAGAGHRRHARRFLPAGERLWDGPQAGIAGGLVVLRHHLLSGPPAGAGAAMDGSRCGAEFRLHAEVPGRDRPRDSRGIRRDSRGLPVSRVPQQA